MTNRVAEPCAESSADAPSHGGLERRNDVQGLRAIAVISVVAYHAGFGFSGGYVGVDVFFVISGYVITRMLLGETRSTGRADLGRFYLRRVRRLLPALAVMLVATLLLSALLAPLESHQAIARTGMSAALFNANTYLALFGMESGYFDLGGQTNSLLHTWSLSVEEQFYFVVPSLMALAWWYGARSGRRRTAAWLLGSMIAVSLLLSWALEYGVSDGDGLGHDLAFYFAPARAWEFAVGAVLAVGAARLARLGTSLSTASVAIGGAAVAFSVFVFDDATRFPGVAVLLPVAGTALMIVGGEANQSGVLSRWLGVAPLRALGDLSYGWYLWHWPLIVFASTLFPDAGTAKPLAALLGLLVAWVSFRRIEHPIRHRSTSTRRTLALMAICVLAPIVAGLFLEVWYRQLNDLPVVQARIPALEAHLDERSGCVNSTPLDQRNLNDCRWGAESPSTTMVLVGDSNAGHFTEAVVGAARSLDSEVIVATQPGCPFVRLQIWNEGVRDRACEAFVDGTTRALLELRPDVVILSSASDLYVELSSISINRTLTEPAEKSAAWEQGLESMIADLRAGGIEVVVVHPIPKFDNWNPFELPAFRLFGPQSELVVTFDRSTTSQQRQRALAAEQTAAQATAAATLDVFDDICPGDPCSNWGPGYWRYRDGRHISVAQSEQLTERFRDVLAASLGLE